MMMMMMCLRVYVLAGKMVHGGVHMCARARARVCV